MSSIWDWPEWVPQKTRKEIERFWGCFGRTPEDWAEDIIIQRMPQMGARVRMKRVIGDEVVEGRYVHAWNNIGRIVKDDGDVVCVSDSRPLFLPADYEPGWVAVDVFSADKEHTRKE